MGGGDEEVMVLYADTHANHFAPHASVFAGLAWLGLHHVKEGQIWGRGERE